MYLCPPLLLTTVVTLLSFHFRAIFCENSSANIYIYSQNMKYSFGSKGTNSIVVFCGFVPPTHKFLHNAVFRVRLISSRHHLLSCVHVCTI